MRYFGGIKDKGGSDKYKYVRKALKNSRDEVFTGRVLNKSKTFDKEKDAAKWVDVQLIRAGKKPVNVLIKQ